MAVESTFRRRILALAFQNSFHGVQKFFRLWVVRELNFPWNCAVWSRNDTMEVKTPNFERDAPRTFNSNLASHTTARILAISANLLCLFG